MKSLYLKRILNETALKNETPVKPPPGSRQPQAQPRCHEVDFMGARVIIKLDPLVFFEDGVTKSI